MAGETIVLLIAVELKRKKGKKNTKTMNWSIEQTNKHGIGTEHFIKLFSSQGG